MDPQATWDELLECIAANDRAQAKLLADALTDWLERGGFPPQTCQRRLTNHWDACICRYVCRHVMMAPVKTGN